MFSMTWVQCPITGTPAWMGCRCYRCRPDLHPWSNNAANMVLPVTISFANTAGANPTVIPFTTSPIAAGYVQRV